MRKNKLIISLVAAIIILSISLIVSVTYNFIGGFYFGRIVKYDSMLGQTQNIIITGEGAFSKSCNFSGSLILDKNFKQEVVIELKETKSPLYLRACAYISGIEEKVKFKGVTNWIYAEDMYFYFNQPVNNLEKIKLCEYLMFDLDVQLNNYKDYIMTFMIEASSSEW